MTSLPAPLLERGRITTLIGPPDADMAALVAAIAVSYRTGSPIVPGFAPQGPSEVVVIIVRRLLREAWKRYRWDARPRRCP